MQRLKGEQCTKVLGIARYIVGDVVRSAITGIRSCFTAGLRERFYLGGNLAMHLGHLREECAHAFGVNQPWAGAKCRRSSETQASI